MTSSDSSTKLRRKKGGGRSRGWLRLMHSWATSSAVASRVEASVSPRDATRRRSLDDFDAGGWGPGQINRKEDISTCGRLDPFYLAGAERSRVVSLRTRCFTTKHTIDANGKNATLKFYM